MQSIPPMVEPSSGSTLAFVAIVAALCALLVFAVARAGTALGEPPAQTRRWTLGTRLLVAALLAGTGLLSASSALAAPIMPPPLALFAFGSLAFAAALAFSPLGTRLVLGLPIAGLVGFQAFRLPLELVLHTWYEQGVLPVQMTFAGHNFDIVTGVLAIAVGLWLRRGAPRAAIWGFNLVGSALLLAVVMIAVLSSPLPIRQYTNDPPVLLAFHFPYGWILPICVGGALFGHLLVFRWLARPAGAA